MLNIFPKNKISEKNLKRIEEAGHSTGIWLKKNRKVRRIYVYLSFIGRRYPRFFITIMVMINVFIIGISILMPPLPKLDIPTYAIRGSSQYNDSIKILEDKIQELLREAKAIGDSVQQVLNKQTLTYDDTIFVVTRGAYLKKINDIIKQ